MHVIGVCSVAMAAIVAWQVRGRKQWLAKMAFLLYVYFLVTFMNVNVRLRTGVRDFMRVQCWLMAGASVRVGARLDLGIGMAPCSL